jgi:hypothetical protein
METDFKTYPAPWQGHLILACRKCQKKLKGNKDLEALAKLKKTIKRHNRKHPERALHLIPIACTGLCPKNGITVCNPAQNPEQLLIVRGRDDIERLAATADFRSFSPAPSYPISTAG